MSIRKTDGGIFAFGLALIMVGIISMFIGKSAIPVGQFIYFIDGKPVIFIAVFLIAFGSYLLFTSKDRTSKKNNTESTIIKTQSEANQPNKKKLIPKLLLGLKLLFVAYIIIFFSGHNGGVGIGLLHQANLEIHSPIENKSTIEELINKNIINEQDISLLEPDQNAPPIEWRYERERAYWGLGIHLFGKTFPIALPIGYNYTRYTYQGKKLVEIHLQYGKFTGYICDFSSNAKGLNKCEHSKKVAPYLTQDAIPYTPDTEWLEQSNHIKITKQLGYLMNAAHLKTILHYNSPELLNAYIDGVHKLARENFSQYDEKTTNLPDEIEAIMIENYNHAELGPHLRDLCASYPIRCKDNTLFRLMFEEMTSNRIRPSRYPIIEAIIYNDFQNIEDELLNTIQTVDDIDLITGTQIVQFIGTKKYKPAVNRLFDLLRQSEANSRQTRLLIYTLTNYYDEEIANILVDRYVSLRQQTTNQKTINEAIYILRQLASLPNTIRFNHEKLQYAIPKSATEGELKIHQDLKLRG